uniref:SH3 domain-containing protein n=1 Tax=Amphimedon queenslandica TaxID=400682 RepID=A0A1X7U1L9_AMPQE
MSVTSTVIGDEGILEYFIELLFMLRCTTFMWLIMIMIVISFLVSISIAIINKGFKVPLPSPTEEKEQQQFPMEGSPEYITMKEMLADLVDLLAGNAAVILQLNNHLLSLTIIPYGVYSAVAHLNHTPNERATRLINSLLTIIQTHSNPNRVFSSLITALQKVGLNNMASKLMEKSRMKGGRINLEQEPSVSEGPLQPVGVTAQSHTPQPTITGSQSSTPTTVIELSSKSEVATNIGNLHSHFASLDSNIRDEFEELVEKGKVKLKAVARSAAAYLSIQVSGIKYGDVDELFDSLQPHYDFFSCGVLKHLTDTYLSNALQTELTQYIDSVDKFSKSSQLKHIRSAIKEKLSSLPAAASPTTSNQTKPVVIKLNDRWEEMTISKLKAVLKHYFGVTSDLFSHISFDYGSFVITLLIPASLSQSIIDTINNKTNSMSRLGILEVAVDGSTIPIRREDNNNFNTLLHESVEAGDSFEVSMLLQLGADPNSKDERGKSAVEIAKQGGHTQIKKILLTTGGMAESIYTARIDYPGIYSDELSFSKGEQLEIYRKDGSFKWSGRSLVSGDEGRIPSSCVYSMFESLQLLEFILSVEEVSLPILQKIRNDSSSNDEKASLFLETINDDPIMISALRQDKEQHDKGITGSVDWYSDWVSLSSPSPVQCNEVISNINNNHKVISLNSSSTNSTVSLLSSTKLHTLNLRRLEIWNSPLTNDCIQYLCILLTNNKTIQGLVISGRSISDRGVTNICQALEHNFTLTSLNLTDNPLITSTSGQALSHLLLNNSSLVELKLRDTSLSTESILLILQSLMDNEKIRTLRLDVRHKETCINTYSNNYHLIQDRIDWW